MTVIYYSIIPPETMQLELISWGDKAEVFYHQLVFDFFFLGGSASKPSVGSKLSSSGDALGQHREDRQALWPIQCYSKSCTSIISDACKLKMELPLTSWGWCGERCVLYPHQNSLVMLCCLLTFCQRRPQSESGLLADSFWWWSQKGSWWCSLVDLNWGIGPWRNKWNIRKKNLGEEL